MDLSDLEYLRDIDLDQYLGAIKYKVKFNSNANEVSTIYRLISLALGSLECTIRDWNQIASLINEEDGECYWDNHKDNYEQDSSYLTIDQLDFKYQKFLSSFEKRFVLVQEHIAFLKQNKEKLKISQNSISNLIRKFAKMQKFVHRILIKSQSLSDVDSLISVRMQFDELKPAISDLLKSLYSLIFKAKLDSLISKLVDSSSSFYAFPDTFYNRAFELFTVILEKTEKLEKLQSDIRELYRIAEERIPEGKGEGIVKEIGPKEANIKENRVEIVIDEEVGEDRVLDYEEINEKLKDIGQTEFSIARDKKMVLNLSSEGGK